MKQLIEFGEVRRGMIGVHIQDLSPDIAEAMKLTVKTGALVAAVGARPPAEAAGLKPGDVIVEIDGKAVHSSSDLRNAVGLVPQGTSLDLSYVRDGDTTRVEIEVASAAPAAVASTASFAETRLAGAFSEISRMIRAINRNVTAS